RIGQRTADAVEAADPENATLCQEDRAPWCMGRTFADGRNRISGEVSRRESSPPGVQRHQGGPAMTIWIYVDTRYRVGHSDHIKAFASPAEAEDWFKEND